MVKLEGDGADDMGFLIIGERVIEELSLIVVLLKLLPSDTLLDSLNLLRMSVTSIVSELSIER